MDGKQSEDIAEDSQSMLSLRILSPSFESNQRLSFENLALSTTIGDVKNLITPLAPNNPPPDQQRLIYRGRPLLNNSSTLESVLEPPLLSVHTLHLVLPPRPELSNGIYVAPDSGLRYRNVSNISPNRSQPILTGPGAPDATRTGRDHTATNTQFQPPRQNSGTPPVSGLNGPPIQPSIPSGFGQPVGEESMRQALEQHRRRAEELNMVVDRARTLINSHTTRMRIQGPNITRSENIGQFQIPPLVSHTAVTSGPNAQAPTASSFNIHNAPNNPVSQSLIIAHITSQIMLLELEVQRGMAPSIESIASARSQLYAILDARYRQPTAASTGVEVEALLLRLQHVNTRAYQIRHSEYVRSLAAVNGNRAGAVPRSPQSSEYYIITTPSGEQMMLTPSTPSTSQQANTETIPVFPDQPQPARGNEINGLGVVPNNVMHNVVREAVLNQQPIRADANANANNGQFGRNVRRCWLFMRLYFFIYLFTEPRTFVRILFVLGAGLIAILSESSIMSRLFNFFIQPIQRHFEGLIHGEGPAAAGQGDANNTNSNNDNDSNDRTNHRGGPTRGAQQGLRRIERAVALFVASLIPGLGERQVEVRNAAEEAARNARQQEQDRIEAANAQNDAQQENLPAPSGGEPSTNDNAQQQQPHQQEVQ